MLVGYTVVEKSGHHRRIVFVAVFSQLPLIYRPAVTTGFLHAQNDPGEASVDTVIKRFDSWPIRQLRPFSAE